MGTPILLAEDELARTPWLVVRQCRFDDGGVTKTYTVVDRQDTVVVVPLSPSGRTVLLRQHRFPTGESSWELPMGGIDEGEDATTAATRELLEETGVVAARVIELASWYPVPGLSAQRATVLLAPVTDETLDHAVSHALPADDIRDRRVVALDEVLTTTDVTDGFTLAALRHVERAGPAQLSTMLTTEEESA